MMFEKALCLLMYVHFTKFYSLIHAMILNKKGCLNLEIGVSSF